MFAMEDLISTFGGCTEITSQTSIIDALMACKLADSKSEAKRFLQGKTVKINSFPSVAVEEGKKITEADCKDGRFLFLLAGKNVKLIKVLAEEKKTNEQDLGTEQKELR
jgi:tyrosyl-tRNA synthetase